MKRFWWFIKKKLRMFRARFDTFGPNDHPHDIRLSWYASGTTSKDQVSDAMRKHVESCAQCQARIPEIVQSNRGFSQLVGGMVIVNADGQTHPLIPNLQQSPTSSLPEETKQ